MGHGFGTLYIVATPIGNLQDITLRAIDVLRKVEYIACEDTRKTGLLLKNLGIPHKNMLISYYEQTEDLRIPSILNLLRNGQDVALVSDSGTPLVSDPGYPLVRECVAQAITVVSVPGPSAAVSALVSSGLPPDKFLFIGFLPRKHGNRLKLLEKVKTGNEEMEATVIIYEAPHRLAKTLMDILQVYGNIQIVLARELTKIHESILRSNVEELLKYFEKSRPKGEFVIMFNTKKLKDSKLLVDL